MLKKEFFLVQRINLVTIKSNVIICINDKNYYCIWGVGCILGQLKINGQLKTLFLLGIIGRKKFNWGKYYIFSLKLLDGNAKDEEELNKRPARRSHWWWLCGLLVPIVDNLRGDWSALLLSLIIKPSLVR